MEVFQMKKFVLAIIIMLTLINLNIKVNAEPSLKDMLLVNTAVVNSNFPSTFDLRTTGKVSTVKNQGNSNSCWAFAAMDSLQSSLLPNDSYDFSENNMKNLNGFDYQSDDGGEKSMAVAYLTRWQGPIYEQNDPFIETSVTSPSDLKVQKHVQDVYFIPGMTSGLDTSQIKKALMDYGAVFTNIKWDPYYYNNMYKSYYYDSSGRVNHSITIVGWDDNFDKNNFNFTPHDNGAFLVKDSNGTSFGENGYYYISYFDALVGTDNACFTAESTDNYDNIYQYDYFGYVSKFGYTKENAYFSNIFNSLKDENLAAVSFYSLYPNCQFEIKAYNNVHEQPDDGLLVGVKTGTIALPGYHTIALDKSIPLKKGDKFSIVVNFKNVNSTETIAIESPEYGYSSGAEANPNESFVSSDGTNWEDISLKIPGTNVCLKAFTVSKPPTTNPVIYKENIVPNIYEKNVETANDIKGRIFVPNFEKIPSMVSPDVSIDEDRSIITIPYDTYIEWNIAASKLKQNLLISIDDAPYRVLGNTDDVKFNVLSNQIIINLGQAIKGEKAKIMILKNTIKNMLSESDKPSIQSQNEETHSININREYPEIDKTAVLVDILKKVICIPYNFRIQPVDKYTDLATRVLISQDGKDFYPLSNNNNVEIGSGKYSNCLIITLERMLVGTSFRVKVLSNTFKNFETSDKQVEEEYTDVVLLESNYSKFDPCIGNPSEPYIVSPKKEFKITFNKPINIDTLYGNIVIVRDDTMKNEEITYALSLHDQNTILIKHEKPFDTGFTYTLYIGDYIKASSGNDGLKNAIKLQFAVEN